MSWNDWFDIRIIQSICKHTATTALAMTSAMFLFWLGRLGIRNEIIRAVLEFTENIVLVTIIGVSVWNLLDELRLFLRLRALYNLIVEWFRRDSSNLAFI